MSFESFNQNPIESLGITNKAKKIIHSLILGAALSHSAEAKDIDRPADNLSANINGITLAESDVSVADSDNIEIQATKDGFKWGVEYFPKQIEHRNILAMRYVKINESTGVKEVLGEFDNLIEASEGLSKIKDLPQNMKKLVDHELGFINTEKSFKASGLVKGVENPVGKTHIEKREFKGYGIEVENKVEVDEKGNVVQLVESKHGSDTFK